TWRRGSLRAERHRYRRVDPAARRPRWHRLARAREAGGAQVPRGHARARLAQARRDAARHARDPGNAADRLAARRPRPRLPGDGWRALLRRRELPALRRDQPSLGGEDARDQRGAGRRCPRRTEAPRAARLRAVARGAERPDLAEPVRPRTSRLAPRVFGDGRALPRAADRHPRRRERSRLSAPRVRDRAERVRTWRDVRTALGARGTGAPRRREDVEVARQHDLRARSAEDDKAAGAAALPLRPSLPPLLRSRRSAAQSRS